MANRDDDYDEDDYCPTCGDLMWWADCWAGCEDGYEQARSDDLGPWPDDPWVPCRECHGYGGWLYCRRESDHQSAVTGPSKESDRG